MNQVDILKKDLAELSTKEKAKASSWFFKTGKGQYGEGDVFIGVTVPEQRKVASQYKDLELSEIGKLLQSKIHEHRLTGLLILADKYMRAGEVAKGKVVKFYLKNTKFVNNWDLVDSSADKILGEYLSEREKSLLYKFAKSSNTWERRIAVVATYTFIKKGKFNDTLKIAEILLSDSHDLIQKATGWMLREVGKRDREVLEEFLQKHYMVMPRTMLRYAIEKFDDSKRRFYLAKQSG